MHWLSGPSALSALSHSMDVIQCKRRCEYHSNIFNIPATPAESSCGLCNFESSFSHQRTRQFASSTFCCFGFSSLQQIKQETLVTPLSTRACSSMTATTTDGGITDTLLFHQAVNIFTSPSASLSTSLTAWASAFVVCFHCIIEWNCDGCVGHECWTSRTVN